MGSHFHHGHVSRGPPIIPDGRVSRVRFETLACLPWVFPSSPRVKRWFTCAPVSVVYPQPRSASCAGFIAGSVSGRRADDETAKCPESLCPILALPPSGRRTRLLGRHCSSVLAHTDSCADPDWLSPTSVFASFEESLQVATSPCCHQDLPDVISASLDFHVSFRRSGIRTRSWQRCAIRCFGGERC